MSRNELNMEELFRAEMESFRVDPSPGLWRKVRARIFWKQFLGFRFRHFNIYYLAAALTLAGTGAWLLSGNPGEDTGPQATPTPVGTETVTVQSRAEQATVPKTLRETEEKGTPEAGSTSRESVQEAGEPGHRDASGEKASEGGQESSVEAPARSTRTDLPETSPEQPVKKAAELSVSAGFSVDNQSGCSPLAVRFRNLSENAARYNWSFGDGGSSTEKDPSYVFDEPGEYHVVLKVHGTDGNDYTAGQSIQVHETPRARFEMDEGTDLSEGRPVYFYNYSKGADYYAWDFGDRQRSNLEEPMHSYENPGSYDVKLKVWTRHQCSDSVIVRNAFTGSENSIIFPNAFTPNMSGPGGGYYDPNDVHNTVFHPVVRGELIEYQLKIFNRQGILIFESNDVSLGWDGYYREKLAAQAVYIWKVRGKFSNGKTFVRSGDVTLVRQY